MTSATHVSRDEQEDLRLGLLPLLVGWLGLPDRGSVPVGVGAGHFAIERLARPRLLQAGSRGSRPYHHHHHPQGVLGLSRTCLGSLDSCELIRIR